MMRPPLLSIVVVVHDMPRQAMNTLRSLSVTYQHDVRADDYEVIVVENQSPRTLDPIAIAALPGQFRYYLRQERGVSPAAAINFGVSMACADCIGLMIDGARMVTPGVVRHALHAYRITADALVAVPGYHLGLQEHQFHATHDHTEAKEQALLDSIGWDRDGYALFSIACLSGANRFGLFHPLMECNCLFLPAAVLAEIGGADERFDMPGGGALNLALYRKAALHPRTRLVVLAGEGSFHQLHGGVTTRESPDRDAMLARMREQLDALLGYRFTSPTIQPMLLGEIGPAALRHLRDSVDHGLRRYAKFAAQGRDPHADDSLKRDSRMHAAHPRDRAACGAPPQRKP